MDDYNLLDMFEDDDHHDGERMTYAKAPFSWLGAKGESLPNILPLVSRLLQSKWVDVFGGSGVVSLNVRDCDTMIYNDRYSGVTDFYKVLQSKDYTKLIDLLECMPPLSREQWLTCKQEWCDEEDHVTRAAKWYYVYRCSVLGLGKSFARATNTKIRPTLPQSLELFHAIHHRMKTFVIENLDFRTCIRDFMSHDALFYLDPPYVNTDQGGYKCRFKESDLRDLLRMIENNPGTYILSGYDNPMIDQCDFWTERYEWRVGVTANLGVVTPTTNRTKEFLWIKEQK